MRPVTPRGISDPPPGYARVTWWAGRVWDLAGPARPFLKINYNFLNQRAGLKAGGWDRPAEGRQGDQGANGSSEVRADRKPRSVYGSLATVNGSPGSRPADRHCGYPEVSPLGKNPTGNT